MIPWILLDKATVPGSENELRLYQHDADFIIKVGVYELMNSRVHHSEDELGRLACQKITNHREQRILIGGLGMGFTLSVALNILKARAQVTVAELVPAVVKWNRGCLAHLAGSPLDDKRVTLYEGDVADKINTAQNLYHAILLDVDNGAQGLTHKKNQSLYTLRGLKAAYTALQKEGVLAIWSPGPDATFKRHLEKVNFKVEEANVRMRGGRKGRGLSVIWLAIKER